MLRLFSPAKINLFLRIAFKRADGYHQLSSVFQTISLGDTLTIESYTHEELTCTDPGVPLDKSNLIFKAIELFRRKTGTTKAFKIHVIKRIPMQAGLGGGSSNAATALWACNRLAKTDIPRHVLQEWSTEIGSDVPFFFSQGTAYCTGRGENVYDLPSLPEQPLWIVKPLEGLSTPEVYRRLNFNANISESSLKCDLDAFLSGSLSYFNDLEKPAFEIRPELKLLKTKLIESGFKTVLMTGSGSSFFCLGKGIFPIQPSLAIFPVHFMNRMLDDWYQEPSIYSYVK